MITYFGYGSIVNIDTLSPSAKTTLGTLKGWRREWRVCGRGSDQTGRCALSVRRDDGCAIQGVLVQEPKTNLADLENREKRYVKVENIHQNFRCDTFQAPGPPQLFLFEAGKEFRKWGSEEFPILQSYLDCVLAGFFSHWGESGIDHFLATTDGWHVPILKDRECPRYPRSVSIGKLVSSLIDHKLHAHGASYLKVE